MTPFEYIDIPKMLILDMSNNDILNMHKQLMRTRKRGITFGLNGRVVMLRRKVAIALVTNEINVRKLVISNQRKRKKNERHKNT